MYLQVLSVSGKRFQWISPEPIATARSITCTRNLNDGKVVVLEYIMLGCPSCIVATEHISQLIVPFEAAHPGRVRQYMFGFIKNYTCAQLSQWKTDNNLEGTVFEDGSSQVGYYGGMGMPTIVVTATNNHTVLYRKLGFEPSDTTADPGGDPDGAPVQSPGDR